MIARASRRLRSHELLWPAYPDPGRNVLKARSGDAGCLPCDCAQRGIRPVTPMSTVSQKEQLPAPKYRRMHTANATQRTPERRPQVNMRKKRPPSHRHRKWPTVADFAPSQNDEGHIDERPFCFGISGC
jgi:hypothetical protein